MYIGERGSKMSTEDLESDLVDLGDEGLDFGVEGLGGAKALESGLLGFMGDMGGEGGR